MPDAGAMCIPLENLEVSIWKLYKFAGGRNFVVKTSKKKSAKDQAEAESGSAEVRKSG